MEAKHDLDAVDKECGRCLMEGDDDRADSLALLLEQLANQYDSPAHLRKAYYYQGTFRVGVDSANLRNREKKLDLAQHLAESARDTVLLAKIFNSKGIWEMERLNWQTAQYYLSQGIALVDNRRSEKIRNVLESNFSEVSRMLNDTLGMTYDREIFEEAMRNGDFTMQRSAAFHCARYYVKEGGDTVALKEYIDVMALNDTLSRLVPLVYARYWLVNGNYEKAYDFIRQSKYNELHEAALTYAQILNKLGRYEESNEYVKALFDLYASESFDNQWIDLHKLYASNLHGLGKNEEAYQQQNLFSEYSDSLSRQRLSDLTKKYEIEFGTEKLKSTVSVQNARVHSLKAFASGLIALVIVIALGSAIYISKRNKLYRSIVSQYMASREREKELLAQKNPEEEASDPEVLINEDSAGNSAKDRTLELLWGRIKVELENRQIWRDPMLSRDSLAAKLGCSHTYLSEVIKKKTGMNYSGYINSFRLKEAKKLLSDFSEDEEISLKEIASQTGFSSLSNFYTLFRQECGMPPAAFRKTAKTLAESE